MSGGQAVETPEAAQRRREAEQRERERQQQRAREEQAKQELQARISTIHRLVADGRACREGRSAVGDICQQLIRLLGEHPELQKHVDKGHSLDLLWRLATGEGQLRPQAASGGMTVRLLSHPSQGCHRD